MLFLCPVWAKLKSQKALERWQPDTEVNPPSEIINTSLRRNILYSPTRPFTGGVRRLQWKRGQQENVRGSEKAGPAVNYIQHFYHSFPFICM